MCGIAGVLEVKKGLTRPEISCMTNALAHRGPDADGFFIDEFISLGHRRLSIIDLSITANQPLFDEERRYCIVFNGEIYNYQELKKDLGDYQFKTSGDTEVILAAYMKWGASCLGKLKGMFALAIWDSLEKVLFLARDRMGVKPLYFFRNDNYFLFASEVRALLASGIVERKLDRVALMDYFSYQSFGYPGAPIANVEQVEAGSYVTIRGGRVMKTKYWEIGEKRETGIDLNDVFSVHNEIKRLFRKSIEQRLISDVPIGAFLSGGIDSSAVVAMMAEVSGSKPRTFNISFSEEGFDESKYAEIVAKMYNTVHQTIRLSQVTFLNDLETALSAVDTPSADGVNTFVVSKAIKQAGITVALSGIGGDELFAGYPFFRRYQKMRRFARLFDLIRPIRELVGNAIIGRDSRTERVASMIKAERMDITYMYPEFRRVLTHGKIRSLTTLDTDIATNLEKVLRSKSNLLSRLPELSQVTAAEYLGYTQNTLLKDTDQMSMAVSLEVREPFFDHELIEFLIQVPDRIKRPIYPKSLLVESLKPMLPNEIVYRKKQGFLFPWKLWMKNEIFEFCNERIIRISEREFIRGKQLLAYWDRFQKGDPQVSWADLWLFVVLEHWMEKNSIQ